MEEKGLTMSAFHPEQHRQYPYNIASPNAHIRKTSIEHMKAYVEDTASFECNRMILCPGWEVLDKRDKDNRKRSVEAIQIISEKAEEFGVTLYMEGMATIHSCFTDSMIKLYDLCIRKKSMGKINVGLPHITDEILYSEPLSTIDFPKVGSKMRLRSIRKDVHNGMILWVYKNTLILTCAGISFEFVDGNSFF